MKSILMLQQKLSDIMDLRRLNTDRPQHAFQRPFNSWASRTTSE
jgi:hypothetical protein